MSEHHTGISKENHLSRRGNLQIIKEIRWKPFSRQFRSLFNQLHSQSYQNNHFKHHKTYLFTVNFQTLVKSSFFSPFSLSNKYANLLQVKMQFSNTITFLLVTLAASTASAAAVRNNNKNVLREVKVELGTRTLSALLPRQSDVDSTHPDEESAQSALEDNRAEGRRKLSGTTANCKSADCHSCMTASTTASLAEVATCGIVAAAAEVGTGGAATAFVVAGFASCETAIVANMAKSVLECEAMP